MGRGSLQSGVRGRLGFARRDDPVHRAGDSGDALLVYPRSGSVSQDSHRHDTRRDLLIENGRITKAIKNFRFNQSLIEMLASVEDLGPAVRAAGEESFEMVVPPMKVRDFHFTEPTRF